MKNIKFIFFTVVLFIGLTLAFIPQHVSAQIIDLPLIASGGFPNAGAWGFGYIKDYRSYGMDGRVTTYTDTPSADGKGPALRPINALIYNTDTNQITLNYVAQLGSSGSSYNFRFRDRKIKTDYWGYPIYDYWGNPQYAETEAEYAVARTAAYDLYMKTDANNYFSAETYIGIYGSGATLGSVTITKGVPGSDTWNCVTFSGTWTLPASGGLGLYQSCGGIILQYMSQWQGNDSSTTWLQFDASEVLYNKTKVGNSYNTPITVVNGKAFSIRVPNSSGKFVGSVSGYGGTVTGYANGADTILTGTFYSVPTVYTLLTIGSDTIQIRGVDPPSTSVATISFY